MNKSTRVYKTEYNCDVCTCNYNHTITLNCNHTFCYDCFKIQLKQQVQCALCQAKRWQQVQEENPEESPSIVDDAARDNSEIVDVIGHKGRGRSFRYLVSYSSGRQSYVHTSHLEQTKAYLAMLRKYQADLRARRKQAEKMQICMEVNEANKLIG